jgi:hypothetical protein
MYRPSEIWKDYGSWGSFCQAQPQFKPILFNEIPRVASKHNQGKSCYVTPGKFECGGLNVLCEVVFEDGDVWLCRAGWVRAKHSAKYVQGLMESTVTTMRYIKKHSDLPVPEVYAYQADPRKSEIGAAYMFLEPIPGTAAKLTGPMEDEPAIQKQVAYVATATGRLTFPRIGWLRETEDGVEIGPMIEENGDEYGPFDTSVEFFRDQVRQLHSEYVSSAAPAELSIQSLFTCWLYEQLALRLDTNNTGPFPLMHPEPCHPQMLLTKEFELKGVIDWDGAGSVPWLLLSCYPALLKVAWPRVDQGRYGESKIKEILDTRECYVDALRHYAAQGERSALEILAILDSEPERLDILDTMYYFGTPYFQDDGRRVYKYLFPESEISFEDFRNDQARWR